MKKPTKKTGGLAIGGGKHVPVKGDKAKPSVKKLSRKDAKGIGVG